MMGMYRSKRYLEIEKWDQGLMKPFLDVKFPIFAPLNLARSQEY